MRMKDWKKDILSLAKQILKKILMKTTSFTLQSCLKMVGKLKSNQDSQTIMEVTDQQMSLPFTRKQDKSQRKKSNLQRILLKNLRIGTKRIWNAWIVTSIFTKPGKTSPN